MEGIKEGVAPLCNEEYRALYLSTCTTRTLEECLLTTYGYDLRNSAYQRAFRSIVEAPTAAHVHIEFNTSKGPSEISPNLFKTF